MMVSRHVCIRASCLLAFMGWGCGPTAQELQLRQLTENVQAMQSQLARFDKRLETLSNDVVVLQSNLPKKSTLANNFPDSIKSTTFPHRLKVVKLEPKISSSSPSARLAQSELGIHGGVPVGGVSPLQLKVAPVPPPPQFPSSDDPSATPLFNQGLSAYQKGSYDDGILFFEEFVGAFDSHSKYGDALYWIAECQFEKKKYGNSVAAYKRYLRARPDGDKRADALLKLGLSYERLHALNEAGVVFKKLLAQFPESALADLAKAHLNERAEGTP